MVAPWPTILHIRICYILEANSKRPIYKKVGCAITEKKHISSKLNIILQVQKVFTENWHFVFSY